MAQLRSASRESIWPQLEEFVPTGQELVGSVGQERRVWNQVASRDAVRHFAEGTSDENPRWLVTATNRKNRQVPARSRPLSWYPYVIRYCTARRCQSGWRTGLPKLSFNGTSQFSLCDGVRRYPVDATHEGLLQPDSAAAVARIIDRLANRLVLRPPEPPDAVCGSMTSVGESAGYWSAADKSNRIPVRVSAGPSGPEATPVDRAGRTCLRWRQIA